ncbi:MAG: hypothetical protein LUC39_06195 [Clostridiales bacterium]|nr:hypothetical protein [Clostridiales bacterium]
MLREDPGFYITNLHSWINGNAFYGSFREMRFLIKPTAVLDKVSGEPLPESRVDVLVWKGEYCLEESEVLNQATFPLTEEGREQVITWMEEQYKWITT